MNFFGDVFLVLDLIFNLQALYKVKLKLSKLDRLLHETFI